MRLNKNYSIILMIILLISNIPIFAFNITDIEIEINLTNKAKKHRTFIINCGRNKNNFLNNGSSFSIFREDNQGILDHIGNLEAISIGGVTCKAKLLNLSTTLNERTLDIKNIAIGDIANPSLVFKIKDLFKTLSSEQLTKSGEKKILEKVMPMINTGEFDKVKIFTFLSRGKSTEKEVAQSSILSESIKKNLIIKHGIPEEFIEVHNIGNLQNLYSNSKKINNSRIEIVFIASIPNENYAITNSESESKNTIGKENSESLDLEGLDLDEELKEFEIDNKIIIKPTEISGPKEIDEPVEQPTNDIETSPNDEQPGEESLKE